MDSDEARDQADRDRIITGTMFNMDWGWVDRVKWRDWMARNLGGMTPGVRVLDDDSAALAALTPVLAQARADGGAPAAPEPWRVPQSVWVGCDCGCPARALWRARGLYWCGHHARQHGITQD